MTTETKFLFNKTEIIAGITTFLTMSYIIPVNPSILATEGTGMSFSGVLTATILVSFLSTLLMGLFARLPFALAPGMGINAFFTFTLILGEQIPWQQALGMVFWSGVFFILISVTPLREMMAKCIPLHLKLALASGIGLFLTFIGLKNASIISASPATLVTHAPFSIQMGLTLIGILVILFFMQRKNPASFLIGILCTTALAMIMGLVSLPEKIFALPDFGSVFMQLDILGALKWAYLPSIITLVVTDLFDSLSTFIGVSHASGMVDENREPKNIKKALLVDAIATFSSSLFGTSAATTYIESSAGTEAGGRTGATAIITALCFLPFLFLSPIISVIPPFATAAVLIIVGALMFRSVAKINFTNMEDAIPAFLVMALIPLTFSITHGILFGFALHSILYLLKGRYKDLNPLIIILSLLGVILIITQ